MTEQTNSVQTPAPPADPADTHAEHVATGEGMPTVGRVVHFWPVAGMSDPQAALIAFVHSDRCVNLAAFDSNGASYSATRVILRQPDDRAPPHGVYCEWMPYQKGQAARTEQLTKDIASRAALDAAPRRPPMPTPGRIVMVREPHHPDYPAIIVEVLDDLGVIHANVFRGTHVPHAVNHLPNIEPKADGPGWYWPERA